MAGLGIRNDKSRSTVLRAVALLESFTFEDVELSLDELARRSGFPRSSTYRIASDLVMTGLLERVNDGYQLGQKLFELGHMVPRHRYLRDVALPYLQDLHEATSMTVNLEMRDGSEIVYVEKLIQRSTTVPHTRSGGRLPAHCTALGKAILAFSPREMIENFLAPDLVALTRHSLTSTEALRRELAEVRTRRIAFDNEESSLGLFCVAAPILGSHGAAVGALSVTGAREAEQARNLAPAVATSARAVSRMLSAGNRSQHAAPGMNHPG